MSVNFDKILIPSGNYIEYKVKNFSYSHTVIMLDMFICRLKIGMDTKHTFKKKQIQNYTFKQSQTKSQTKAYNIS